MVPFFTTPGVRARIVFAVFSARTERKPKFRRRVSVTDHVSCR
jgi:hypothetical protein